MKESDDNKDRFFKISNREEYYYPKAELVKSTIENSDDKFAKNSHIYDFARPNANVSETLEVKEKVVRVSNTYEQNPKSKLLLSEVENSNVFQNNNTDMRELKDLHSKLTVKKNLQKNMTSELEERIKMLQSDMEYDLSSILKQDN